MKPTKKSIAFVIYDEARVKFLIVRRPPDDENLSNVWGLPAGSLREREIAEDAVMRSAREKLGVSVDIVKEVGRGEIERDEYTLQMKEYEVKIKNGKPKVPQSCKGITQYSEWKWGAADDLVEAAQKGSLCSRIYLKSMGKTW